MDGRRGVYSRISKGGPGFEKKVGFHHKDMKNVEKRGVLADPEFTPGEYREIFPSPNLGGGGGRTHKFWKVVQCHIFLRVPTYFFIFPTYYIFIFPHIPSYFLHIPCKQKNIYRLLHRDPECRDTCKIIQLCS